MKSGAEPRAPLEIRGAGLFDRLDYRLIETPEDRDAVYAMRYRAYLHGGLISPSASQRIVDTYDDAPNAWIFGIYLDGELCSSLRLHVLTSEWRMSYTTELFGDVLNSRLDRGEVFVDPARFAADPDKSQRFHELPYLTLRLAYLACDHFNADLGLAMVRTDHQAFYRRIFLHETLTEPRPFPGWHSRKVVLMASDFAKLRERVLTRFPIMRSSAFERRMLFDRVGQTQPVSRPVLVPATTVA
ncbi:N-acyl amino acid synthase FeeM domain-containing protein [Bradyrhizobium ganzhouense]|uniref:N-acyl amino acid synthase FeeM domain-containing protein n=1 Tax=Bradyrhizobium ganzhouense TaxID=1179767 RepID=UPI003CEC3BA1